MAGRKEKQKANIKIFAVRLTERMIDCKVSNSELGEFLGVMPQAISGYRQGSREPNIDSLVKIAKKLNTSIDYLTGKEDDPEPNPDVVAMSKYTGLSSEAIEVMHLAQTDTDNKMAQAFRNADRKNIHLLSWIIAHERDINNVADDRESLLDDLHSYFHIDSNALFELEDAVKLASGDCGLIGRYTDDEIVISQGSAASYLTTNLLETSKVLSIQDCLKKLKKSYWNEIQKKGDARSVNDFDDEKSFEDINTSLPEI